LTFAAEGQAADLAGLLQRVLICTLLGLPLLVAVGRWQFPGDAVSRTPTRPKETALI
jgi:hypothetical protein